MAEQVTEMGNNGGTLCLAEQDELCVHVKFKMMRHANGYVHRWLDKGPLV